MITADCIQYIRVIRRTHSSILTTNELQELDMCIVRVVSTTYIGETSYELWKDNSFVSIYYHMMKIKFSLSKKVKLS